MTEWWDEEPTVTLHNADCMSVMCEMDEGEVDVVLTSPFYNTNKKAGKGRTLQNTSVKEGQYDYVRYDMHVDDMTNEEYADYTVRLFEAFDRVLSENGCVLYNLSYGSENTTGMFDAVHAVTSRTPFTLADVIVWKKRSAFPNSCSPNKLTRITEFVFVFCRERELRTFRMNKRVVSTRKTGQRMYENLFNFVEAPNNDETCPYNKATFSSELCQKLLTMYAPEGAVVYDPFMGSGTTGVACARMGLECVGSEISPRQVEWAAERVRRECPEVRVEVVT